MKKIYDAIKEEAKKYNIDKVILFGSRARGDNRPKSDIDIAIYGKLNKHEKTLFSIAINEDMPTLLKFDFVFVDDNTSKELVQNIEKDGILIYEKI